MKDRKVLRKTKFTFYIEDWQPMSDDEYKAYLDDFKNDLYCISDKNNFSLMPEKK